MSEGKRTTAPAERNEDSSETRKLAWLKAHLSRTPPPPQEVAAGEGQDQSPGVSQATGR